METQKKTWKEVLKAELIPMAEPEVRADLDRRNVRSVRLISGIIFVCELLVLISFILTQGFGEDKLVSIRNTSIGILICGVAFLVSHLIIKLNRYSHGWITVIIYFASVSICALGMLTDLQHYREGEQMLSLFCIVFVLIVFVNVHPLGSILSNLVVFGGQYLLLYLTDGAERVNIFNYAMLAAICIISAVFRYSQRVFRIRKTLEMEEANRKLQEAYRRDGITGCNNRTALAEDYKTYYNKPMTVIMSDIDYFKRFNDRYGHQAGDDVLRQTAAFLVERFSEGAVYRYGGDEFLIFLNEQDEQKVRQLCGVESTFEIPVSPKHLLFDDGNANRARLSFGIAFGKADSEIALNELVAEADRKLYLIKRELHKND